MLEFRLLSSAPRRGFAVARLIVMAAAVLAGTTARTAWGQASKDSEAPPPESVDLRTRDGVQLKAMFFPGTNGKESVPVVLLHMHGGSGQDFHGLAAQLQEDLGAAVLVPDLRGHGGSTRLVGGDREIELATMPLAQYKAMARFDVEACKQFLMDKNNAGELNVDRLCIVGAELGASVGMLWAALDWRAKMLLTGKQGQDVKALVLISPSLNFKGLRASDALAPPDPFEFRTRVAAMVAVGNGDSGAVGDARRVYKLFERFRPNIESEPPAKRDLLLLDGYQTRLQGTRILEEPSLALGKHIALFIKMRVVDRAGEFPWKERQNPFN